MKQIIAPLTVNLLTAAILFGSAVALRDDILDFFSRSNENWPIYAVLEPREVAQGEYKVEVFVINLDDQDHSHASLRSHLDGLRQSGHVVPSTTHVYLRWEEQAPGGMKGGCQQVSDEPGKLIEVKDGNSNQRTIRIELIKSLGILRCVINVDYPLTGFGPGKKGLFPLKLHYPGRNGDL